MLLLLSLVPLEASHLEQVISSTSQIVSEIFMVGQRIGKSVLTFNQTNRNVAIRASKLPLMVAQHVHPAQLSCFSYLYDSVGDRMSCSFIPNNNNSSNHTPSEEHRQANQISIDNLSSPSFLSLRNYSQSEESLVCDVHLSIQQSNCNGSVFLEQDSTKAALYNPLLIYTDGSSICLHDGLIAGSAIVFPQWLHLERQSKHAARKSGSSTLGRGHSLHASSSRTSRIGEAGGYRGPNAAHRMIGLSLSSSNDDLASTASFVLPQAYRQRLVSRLEPLDGHPQSILRAEINAILRGIQIARTGHCGDLFICCDNNIVLQTLATWPINQTFELNWADGAATQCGALDYGRVLEEIATFPFNIYLCLVKSHAGDPYNDLADRLAKSASRLDQLTKNCLI